jgi:hypothetical protein
MPRDNGPPGSLTEHDLATGEQHEPQPDAVPEDEAGQPSAQQREWQAWVALLQQVIATGGKLSTVLSLELRLALADGRRLVMVTLAMIPLLLLMWLGLSVLVGWLVFVQSQSVALGIVGFVLMQLLTQLLLLRAARVYRRSLGLPASRRQLQAMMETGGEHATTTTDS